MVNGVTKRVNGVKACTPSQIKEPKKVIFYVFPPGGLVDFVKCLQEFWLQWCIWFWSQYNMKSRDKNHQSLPQPMPRRLDNFLILILFAAQILPQMQGFNSPRFQLSLCESHSLLSPSLIP